MLLKVLIFLQNFKKIKKSKTKLFFSFQKHKKNNFRAYNQILKLYVVLWEKKL
jgi:hypothetical protein